MLFSSLTLFSNLYRGKRAKNTHTKYCILDWISELCFHLNDSECKQQKIMQDFYLQNQDTIKFVFSLSVFCRLTRYLTWLHIFMCLQFKSRNRYNIREQFSSILSLVFRTCREIVLDNRSSVHEFLMHFSRLFSYSAHIHMFCGENALEISIYLKEKLQFTVEWVLNLNSEAIIRIVFSISSNWVFDSSIAETFQYVFNASRHLFTVSSALYSTFRLCLFWVYRKLPAGESWYLYRWKSLHVNGESEKFMNIYSATNSGQWRNEVVVANL